MLLYRLLCVIRYIIREGMHIEGGFSKVYNQQGVAKFYSAQGAHYSNPHKYDIQRLLRKKLTKSNPYITPSSRILDLACGSGQVSAPLLSYGYTQIRGCDPYTSAPYIANTGLPCDTHTFTDILNGAYQQGQFDCIICSYALHLVKESMLHDFCVRLSYLGRWLIVIAPHKLPVMKGTYGWGLVEEGGLDKVHWRVFRSYNWQGGQNEKAELGEQGEVRGQMKEEAKVEGKQAIQESEQLGNQQEHKQSQQPIKVDPSTQPNNTNQH